MYGGGIGNHKFSGNSLGSSQFIRQFKNLHNELKDELHIFSALIQSE
jgi:hypothetical protein